MFLLNKRSEGIKRNVPRLIFPIEQIATRLAEVAVAKFGRIDGVVINHGVLENKKLADMSVENFRSMYEINVVSCFAMVGPKTGAVVHRLTTS